MSIRPNWRNSEFARFRSVSVNRFPNHQRAVARTTLRPPGTFAVEPRGCCGRHWRLSRRRLLTVKPGRAVRIHRSRGVPAGRASIGIGIADNQGHRRLPTRVYDLGFPIVHFSHWRQMDNIRCASTSRTRPFGKPWIRLPMRWMTRFRHAWMYGFERISNTSRSTTAADASGCRD